MSARLVVLGRESNLSEELARQDAEATLLSGRELRADPRSLDRLRGTRIHLVVNAFRTATQLKDVPDRLEFVSAALAPTALLLDRIRELDVERLIYTSSCSVYGDRALCGEEDAPSPKDLHAALKLASEMLVQQACEEAGVPFTIARVFNLFGGNDRFSVVSKLLRAARDHTPITLANKGDAVRDFVHVRDVARTYAAILRSSDLPLRLNVGSGRGVAIRDLVDVLQAKGARLDIKHVERAEIARSTASTDRLRRIIDPATFIRVEDHVARELIPA